MTSESVAHRLVVDPLPSSIDQFLLVLDSAVTNDREDPGISTKPASARIKSSGKIQRFDSPLEK